MKTFLCAISAAIVICLIGSVVGCVSGSIATHSVGKMLKGN